MQKTLIIPAAVTLALGASAARAAETLPADTSHPDAARPPIAAAFGNTVFSIYPDGRSQKIWIHPDGTWNGKSRRGIDLSGRWNMKGDKVCLRQSHPPTLPISFCQTVPRDPGVELTSRDLTGQTIRLKIVKGITETGT
jgi:hypothetical protein